MTAKELRKFSKKFTILYAEDEELLRTSMQNSLEKLFKEVWIAKDGKEALKIFLTHPVDIILTDINMPNINGIDLIKEVQSNIKQTPAIIVLTAYNDANILKELIDLSVDRFISKPVNKLFMLETFYVVVKKLFDAQMVKEYQLKLHIALGEAERKQKILENKLEQVALYKYQQEQKTNTNITQNNNEYFNELLQEDRDEINDLLIEIDQQIMILLSSHPQIDDSINKLSKYFKLFAKVLNSYPEFLDISDAMQHFSIDLLEHKDTVEQQLEDMIINFESIYHTMNMFVKNIWNQKNSDPKFYNPSLISDFEYLSKTLNGELNSIETAVEFF